jgi:hypothetical protein
LANLYDTDFYAWTQAQAALIRAAQVDKLDWDHLLEEIEDLAGNARRALQSALRIALLHLLKWRYRPERRSTSWIQSIDEHRARVDDITEESPSLKPQIPELFRRAYSQARRHAARQTRLPLSTFPEACPWTLADVLDENFWPETQ